MNAKELRPPQSHSPKAALVPDKPRRILFLNHSASRNGASILLLHLLQWLAEHADFELEVVSDGGGPLIDEFRATARTRVWHNPVSFMRALDRPWVNALRVAIEGRCLRLFLGRRRYDLVYANTAACWPQVAALGQRQAPLLWHIHELPYALGLIFPEARSRQLLPGASRVVAVSSSVASTLTGDFAVARDRVDMVHGFVPVHDISPDDRQARRLRLFEAFGWPADAFVVGGCGGPGWRKGTDLFLQLARLARIQGRNDRMRFLWVGGGDGDHAGRAEREFQHDLTSLGLTTSTRRVPTTDTVDDYYCAMDVFALTSREDPFPLVMLEAAMHRLPTVCFAAAGGAPEFVGTDAGVVVPYLDLAEFMHALEALSAASVLCLRFGKTARARALCHHSVDTQAPKLLHCIERCLAAAG